MLMIHCFFVQQEGITPGSPGKFVSLLCEQDEYLDGSWDHLLAQKSGCIRCFLRPKDTHLGSLELPSPTPLLPSCVKLPTFAPGGGQIGGMLLTLPLALAKSNKPFSTSKLWYFGDWLCVHIKRVNLNFERWFSDSPLRGKAWSCCSVTSKLPLVPLLHLRTPTPHLQSRDYG
ncbi:hypothetical protein HJG60_009224 [Phyllostomus discolor]|uniref:Uncharacterized protein n=1 Tax=Phyllostomus discolor TaxID=89673 RepID=A0A833YS69_9CHIR|nr:hypothetical protein HJG60_009224 [Phyllostomus discolor]